METLEQFFKRSGRHPLTITQCNKCGANEFTLASINVKCYFCNGGIMRLVK